LYDVFVHTTVDTKSQPAFLIEYDARVTTVSSDALPLLSLLKRYVLRAKVRLRDATEDYDAWAAWGSEAEQVWDGPRRWAWARSGVVEPVWEESEWPWGAEREMIRDRRAVGMGIRRLVQKGGRRKYTLQFWLFVPNFESVNVSYSWTQHRRWRHMMKAPCMIMSFTEFYMVCPRAHMRYLRCRPFLWSQTWMLWADVRSRIVLLMHDLSRIDLQ